ncbi:MAG: glycosyltransferase family 4 protein [Flavobacteriales bacterium]|nr:MAG: hypothetical protein UZ06_CHB003000928 [Chlorobi bacterium OLB6]MBE2264939.1 glycosyltransferase family 4 protein [Flavobacteriales bacterium]MBV6462798.1 hypothetical protein [Chlorobiota bacterium]MBW7854187.1 glycosyltransferase family 4 protein [Candidatus Kapabacteria bacterium]MCC6332224.1 glycosyltransferase family 4 protein [Ignavibacteria bacterium]
MPDIILHGPFPPPFGGVALHIIRLAEQLVERGFGVRGHSTAGVRHDLPWVRKEGFPSALQRTPVHLHTDEGNARRTVLLGRVWTALRRPYALTVHSFRHRPDLEHFDAALAGVYHNARAIIAISSETRTALVERLKLNPDTISVIPSALPVSHWEQECPKPDLPNGWLQAKVRVLANAGRVVRYNGADLYGIDTLLDAHNQLSSPDMALLIVLGEIVDNDLYRLYQERVQALRNVFLVHGLQSPLAPVVHEAHIVVRPTRTEGGESLTLVEAIEDGVWAVGSDSVRRPPEAVLFKTGDAADLARVLHTVSTTDTTAPAMPRNAVNAEAIIQLFTNRGLLPQVTANQ